VALADGRQLEVRGKDIGIVRDSTFRVWPVTDDIVIGGVLYVPPLGSPYRAQSGVLGKYRLNLGNAVGLHGTTDKASIGKAVTHGCMRLADDDIEWLFLNVPVGTAVYIY
jgi:lipoprotein-anchoring transpeptidase ErfK/SrfK